MDTGDPTAADSRQVTGKEAYKKGINKAKFEPVKDSGSPQVPIENPGWAKHSWAKA